MRVAFLGLGIMGRSMAAKLAKAGHEVAIWNRTPGKDVEGARTAPIPGAGVGEPERSQPMASFIFGPVDHPGAPLTDLPAELEASVNRGHLASGDAPPLGLSAQTFSGAAR